MSALTNINLPLDEIRAFCESQPIARLSLFGSALHGELTSESDIDLLVEYVPGAVITYIDMAGQEIDLSAIVGRQVDLRTAQELSRYFRQDAVESAQLIYERGA